MSNAKLSSFLVAENGQPLEIPESPMETRGEDWVDGTSLKASYDVYYRYRNDDHFKYATNQSDESINTREVRHAIAKLVRYELRNNPTFKGFIDKLIHSVVRTGPVVDIVPDRKSQRAKRAAKTLEQNWQDHADQIKLVPKLRTMFRERLASGEGFALFRRNPNVPIVGIDLQLYEMEQFQDIYDWDYGYRYADRYSSEYPPADGIYYDRYGNPEVYHRLTYHPGGTSIGSYLTGYGYKTHPANRVIHWFNSVRPTTRRGISEGADCIETLGKLRRLDESVLNTLEKESKILASMETNLPIGSCTTITSPRMSWDWAGAQVTSTPQGWKMSPWNTGSGRVQSYREVKDEMKREIAARFLLPWNVATSSENFNFASARIDTMIFHQVVTIIRDLIEKEILNRYFWFWFEFAMFAGLVPDNLGTFRIRWHWPEKEPLDQLKQAKADQTYYQMGQFDEVSHWKNRGRNAIDVFEERVELAKQKREVLARHGMTADEFVEMLPAENANENGGTDDVVNALFE